MHSALSLAWLLLWLSAAQGLAETAQNPLTGMQSHCIKLSRLIPDIKIGTVMVSCEKERVEWRIVHDEPSAIENSTTWFAGMTNLYYSVPLKAIKVEHEPNRCQVLEKWKGRMSLSVALSCSDVLDIRDLADFCEERFRSAPDESQESWAGTGQLRNTCGTVP